MNSTPELPSLDNQRPTDNHKSMEARIARLEAYADSTGKLLDATQQRMLEGFNGLRAELMSGLNELRAEFRPEITVGHADIAGLRSDIANLDSDVNALRVGMTDLQIRMAALQADVGHLNIEQAELRKDMSTMRREVNVNFRWLIGIQISTIFMLLGLLGKTMQLF